MAVGLGEQGIGSTCISSLYILQAWPCLCEVLPTGRCIPCWAHPPQHCEWPLLSPDWWSSSQGCWWYVLPSGSAQAPNVWLIDTQWVSEWVTGWHQNRKQNHACRCMCVYKGHAVLWLIHTMFTITGRCIYLCHTPSVTYKSPSQKCHACTNPTSRTLPVSLSTLLITTCGL